MVPRRTAPANCHRWGRAWVCFFSLGCCTARRSLRVLRSCIYMICLDRGLYTGCMYVTIIGETSPCMPSIILDFAAASYLVWVCTQHVEAIAICAIRLECYVLGLYFESKVSVRLARAHSFQPLVPLRLTRTL